MTGVDPSQRSLVTAFKHAAQSDLRINYVAGVGELLPFANASYDIVICCDVLEHVETPASVIDEIARVLKPKGIFFYDTINRTLISKLVVITLFQNWRVTSCAPANLHDWNKFIKPTELRDMMAQHGLQNRVLRGMRPSANPIDLICQMRKRKGRNLLWRVGKTNEDARRRRRLDFIHWLGNEAQLTGIDSLWSGLIGQL